MSEDYVTYLLKRSKLDDESRITPTEGEALKEISRLYVPKTKVGE